jgi:hypothetical protein
MKLQVMTCGLLLCAATALSAEGGDVNAGTAVAEDRLFLPHNFVRGYAEFQIAPPHNEPDLGLCLPGVAPSSPGVAACAAFARYIWNGYVEIQPVGRGSFRRLFVFAEPKVFGGDNLPQKRYTAAASGILWEQTLGAGVKLPRQFELRLTNHRVKLLGRYSSRDVITARPDGPYGLYTTVGVRWYFGGYGSTGSR